MIFIKRTFARKEKARVKRNFLLVSYLDVFVNLLGFGFFLGLNCLIAAKEI